MTGDDLKLVEEQFAKAIEVTDHEARIQFVRKQFLGRPDLQSHLQKLVANYFAAGDFLEPTRELKLEEPDASMLADATSLIGKSIHQYRLTRLLGEGGMGCVFAAEQSAPVQRTVALKLIRESVFSSQRAARLEMERQSLALMEHPNIARFLDAGTTTSGSPFFVMELVDGLPITDYCDRHRMNLVDRLELFVPICNAVQHAHHKGIIHRDLKPSNVLVARYDGVATPKVIDFGIAKVISDNPVNISVTTQHGVLFGTLEYMSPEQASGTQGDIDTRADIYGLGTILYELLTGSPPLTRDHIRNLTLDEIFRIIRTEDPPRPSKAILESGAISKFTATKASESSSLSARVRGELDWIVMKALEKDRDRRYSTAGEFANDIQNFLADRPVNACPPSRLYQLKKLTRRHRWPIAASAALLICLLAGAIATSVQSVRAGDAERRAEAAYLQELDARKKAQRAEQTAEIAANRANQEAVKARQLVAQLQVARGIQHVEAGNLFGSLNWFVAAMRTEQDDHDRERVHRLRIAQTLKGCPKLSALVSHNAPISKCTFNEHGDAFATASSDGTARVWDLVGNPISPPLTFDSPVNDIRFAPDGRSLAVATGRRVLVSDIRSGETIGEPMEHEFSVARIGFADAGALLVAVGREAAKPEANVRFWELASRQPVIPDYRHRSRGKSKVRDLVEMGLSPDGHRLFVIAPHDPDLMIWDLEHLDQPPRRLLTGHNVIRHAEFSSDGRQLLTCGWDSTARVWDVDSGDAMTPPLPHKNLVVCGKFSPHDQSVITSSYDQKVRVWSIQTGQLKHPPITFSSTIEEICLSPDGLWVFASGRDGTIQVRDLATGDPVTPSMKQLAAPINTAIDPTGRFLLTRSKELEIARVWDLAGAVDANGVLLHSNAIGVRTQAVFGPEELIASYMAFRFDLASNAVQIWDAATLRPTGPRIHHPDGITTVAFCSDESKIGVASWDGNVRVWDTRTGVPLTPWMKHGGQVTSLVWHPHGETLATASVDGAARLWNAHDGRLLASLPQSSGESYVRFSPNGDRLITGTDELCVWEVKSGKLLSKTALPGRVKELHFCNDGRLQVTTGINSSIWEVEKLAQISPRVKQSGKLTGGDFSPDGDRFITSGYDGLARMWDLEGKAISQPLKHDNAVHDAFFIRAAELILTVSDDRTARLWDVQHGEPVSPPLRDRLAKGRKFAAVSADHSMIAVEGSGVRIHRIDSDARPLADLKKLATLYVSEEITEDGFVRPLESAELIELYHDLRQSYVGDFQATPEETQVWIIDRANAAQASGHFEAALAIWNQVISAEPGRWEFHCARGLCAEALGKTTAALEDFQLAVEFGGRSVPALAALANNIRLNEDAGEPLMQLATSAAEQLIELAPSHAMSWKTRGDVHSANQEYEAAIECYSRAIAIKETVGCLNNRAVQYARLGKLVEAVADLRRCDAIGIDDPYGTYNLARMLARSGDYSEALTTYQRALQSAVEFPANTVASLRIRSLAIPIATDLGLTYAELGEYDKAALAHETAEELARSLLQQHPDQSVYEETLWKLKYLQALLAAYNGDIFDAERLLAEFVHEDEAWIDGEQRLLGAGHGLLGQVLRYRNPEQAEVQVRHAKRHLQLSSDDNCCDHPTIFKQIQLAKVSEQMGWLHYDRHADTEAATAFRTAVEHAERASPGILQRSLVALILGRCPLDSIRDPVRSSQLAREVLDQAPRQVIARRAMGFSSYYQGDWNQVLEYLTPFDRDAECQVHVAIAHARLGQFQQARQHVELARRIADNAQFESRSFRDLFIDAQERIEAADAELDRPSETRNVEETLPNE